MIDDELREKKEPLSIARRRPEAVNKLLAAEQIVYMLAWHKLIGTIKSPVVYNAIGPDLTTQYFLTNAEEVIGFDLLPVNVRTLEAHLNDWDSVEDSYPDEGPGGLSVGVEWKMERGFWNVEYILKRGIERCILIELKRMSVDQNTISVSERNGSTQIEFDWAFPGEKPKRRAVTYVKGTVLDACTGITKLAMPKTDCFYSKSLGGFGLRYGEEWFSGSALKAILPYVTDGGVIVLGRSLGDIEKQKEFKQKNLGILQKSCPEKRFVYLDVHPIFTTMMKELHSDKQDFNAYGWQLYGFRKLIKTRS